jgi:hypothetical protein
MAPSGEHWNLRDQAMISSGQRGQHESIYSSLIVRLNVIHGTATVGSIRARRGQQRRQGLLAAW